MKDIWHESYKVPFRDTAWPNIISTTHKQAKMPKHHKQTRTMCLQMEQVHESRSVLSYPGLICSFPKATAEVWGPSRALSHAGGKEEAAGRISQNWSPSLWYKVRSDSVGWRLLPLSSWIPPSWHHTAHSSHNYAKILVVCYLSYWGNSCIYF